MKTIELSLGPLAWHIFNQAVLIAVVALPTWLTVRAICRVLAACRRKCS